MLLKNFKSTKSINAKIAENKRNAYKPIFISKVNKKSVTTPAFAFCLQDI